MSKTKLKLEILNLAKQNDKINKIINKKSRELAELEIKNCNCLVCHFLIENPKISVSEIEIIRDNSNIGVSKIYVKKRG
jgi:hypothetical protein